MRRRVVKTRLTSADVRRPPEPPPRARLRRDARRRRSRSGYDGDAVEVEQRAVELFGERRPERVPVERRRARRRAPRRRTVRHDLDEPADAARDPVVVDEVDVVRAEEDDDEVDRCVRMRGTAAGREGRSGLPSRAARSSQCGRSTLRRSPPIRRRGGVGAAPATAPRAGTARRPSRGRSPTCSSRRSRRASSSAQADRVQVLLADLVDAREQVVDVVVLGMDVPAGERVVASGRELAHELRRELGRRPR